MVGGVFPGWALLGYVIFGLSLVAIVAALAYLIHRESLERRGSVPSLRTLEDWAEEDATAEESLQSPTAWRTATPGPPAPPAQSPS